MLNLDVYIAYNYERLGFPSNAALRNDLEKEVQKCLLGVNVKDELKDKELKKKAEDIQKIEDLNTKVVSGEIEATKDEFQKVNTPNAQVK